MYASPRLLPRPVPGRQALSHLALLLLLLLAARLQPLPDDAGATRPAALVPAAFPLLFLEGELPRTFTAAVAGGTVDLAPEGLSLSVAGAGALRLRFEGSDGALSLDGVEGGGTVANLYAGNDPARWRVQQPAYAAVTYRGLYPGIDLRYDGTVAALKGTYTVAPGADPARIRWRYEGAKALHVEPTSGELHILLPGGGRVVERAPVAWQEIAGGHVPVPVRFAVQGAEARFLLPEGYALDQPLIIDPALALSTFFGGTKNDYINGIDVDASGAIYLTGYTFSDDLGGVAGSSRGNTAAFAAKLNGNASAVEWVTYLDGLGGEQGRDIAVDGAGRAWLTGYTASSDFPTTPDAYQGSFGGFYDVIAVQLNAATGAMEYSTYVGNADLDEGNGVAVDGAGNAYITGQVDQSQVLALKFSPAHALVYGVAWGGDGQEWGNDIAVDGSGRAYVTGTTGGIPENNFDVVNGFQTSCARYSQWECSRDAFVSVVNAAGTALAYSSFLGGGGIPNSTAGSDEGLAIAVDGAGYIYVAGTTTSGSFPLAAPFQGALGGSDWLADGFVTKLTPAGDALVYSTYLGGAYSDDLLALDVDDGGSVVVVGYTNSPDFPSVNAIQPDLDTSGICGSYLCRDATITQLGPGGTVPFSSFLGGLFADYGNAVVLHGGSAYVAGVTNSLTFPTTGGVVQPVKKPFEDGFVSRISLGVAPPPPTPGPPPGNLISLYLPVVAR